MSLLWIQQRRVSGAVFGILFVLLPACARTRDAWAAAIPPSPLNAPQSGTTLVFYAEPQVSEDLWPALFQVVRADLADGAGEISNGVVLDKDPTFVRGNDDLHGISFSNVISVKLLGRCDVLPQPDRPLLRGPLGWVLLVSGRIQPFIFIDCARIAQVLRPKAASLHKEDRQYAMEQAIAHVLIHEWSHIAGQTSTHTPRGVTQAYFSANELVAGPKNNHLTAASH